jgi:hypothetical protein
MIIARLSMLLSTFVSALFLRFSRVFCCALAVFLDPFLRRFCAMAKECRDRGDGSKDGARKFER